MPEIEPVKDGKTAALLLAAGESRRMGQLKALLPWQGTTLLSHQLAALDTAGVGCLMVVLGHRAGELQEVLQSEKAACPGLDWVVNPDYLQGKTTSIKAGLRALSAHNPQTILILNVDQPRRPALLGYLLRQHRAAAALITIPAYRGKGGHPVIVDAALLDDLDGITEETQGLRAVMARHKAFIHRAEVDTPEALWDLNTPEEYRAALG